MKITHLTNSPSQTQRLGHFLAREILERQTGRGKASVLGLVGELGGGKTTLLQGFAKNLGVKERVSSPTFLILRRFRIRKSKLANLILNFYHVDCYRIQKPREILALGFKKIISNPQNIIAIEWADKIRDILPKNIAWIKFKFIDKNKRKIEIRIPKQN
jgi:tRNA threonylcarbamoyladenosine biosynthesis protein TsaE